LYNWINIPFLYLEWLKSLYLFFFLITDICYLTSIWLQGYKLDNFTIYRTSVQMRKAHILSIIMPYDNWWVVIIISFIPSFHRNNFCQLFNWFQLFSYENKFQKLQDMIKTGKKKRPFKGVVDGFSYFHWFSVLSFLNQNHPVFITNQCFPQNSWKQRFTHTRHSLVLTFTMLSVFQT
jgi:hypothetical protein